MDSLIYVSSRGVAEIMQAQMVEANNLANINTPGFREDLHNASAVEMKGEGLPSRIYAMADAPSSNLSVGSLMKTGRDLDLAINGDGWFAVNTPEGERYTRAGNFELTPNGQLLSSTGMPVMGNSGPILLPPADKVTIGKDGTISIRPAGQDATSIAIVDRIKLVKPDPKQLVKSENGLFRMKNEEIPVADASVKIETGMLESSNVNSVDALVNFISLARQFEMQMKLIDNAKENSDHTAQLLQL